MSLRPVVAFAAVLLLPATGAAQYNWTGSTSGSWSNASNWDPAGGPPNSAGAAATFGDAGTTTAVTVDTAITVGSITFDSFNAYTVGLGAGGSLTLNNGPSTNSVITATGNSFSPTVSANFTVGGNGNLDLSSQSPFPFGGLTVSGAITASGGTVAITQGTVTLSGTNTYSAATRVDGGAILVADPGAGLSGNSNLNLNGGQVQLTTATSFTRSLGTGAGQVQFASGSGGGGFAYSGSSSSVLAVRLNNGTGTLTWASTPNFLAAGDALILGSAFSFGVVDFQNGIDLNGADRRVRVDGPQPGSVTGIISGVISNSSMTAAGLAKNGSGALQLTGANSYTGPTTVLAGTLVAADGVGLPSASNLVLDGGTYDPQGPTFTRSVGTAAGQVQWASHGGGFASSITPLTVRLNNNTATVTWGAAGFVPSGAPLILDSRGSLSVVGLDFQNGINLNGGTRTIRVIGSSVARISGAVVNSAGAAAGLTVTGGGVLELTGTNTYNGPTTVQAGVLRASLSGGLPAASNLTLNGGVYQAVGGGTFNRTIGTAAGQVQWGANGGGLATSAGTLAVQLNGGTGTLAWGSTGFIPDGQDLVLGAFGTTTAGTSGLLDFQNGIDLNGADRTINLAGPAGSLSDFSDTVRVSGAISNTTGTAGLTVTGGGVLELTGTNSYTGQTVVQAGALTPVLRANPGQGLPNASNLLLDGGVYETSGNVTFTRALGTAGGQVNVDSGGFSSYNGRLNIQLNGGTGTLTWGSANFLPSSGQLLLWVNAGGGYTGQSVVDFQNGIDLDGATRTVVVSDLSRSGGGHYSRISGVIGTSTGTAGLTVLGQTTAPSTNLYPTLELSAANTYTGPTTVRSATLRAADGVGLPAASNLVLDSGVFEGIATATFNRTIGTAAGQVQWAAGGSGGFSSGTGTLTVRLNNGAGTLTWGSTNFVGSALQFGSRTAGGLVDFQNGLDLAGQSGQILVTDNPASTADLARVSGVISNGSLFVNGSGVLELTAANTYAGGTTVSGATLRVSNTTGSGTGSGTVAVFSGALQGTGTVAGSASVSGGTLRAGDAAGVGTLTFGNGLQVVSGAKVAFRVTDGSTPSASAGGSTVGTDPVHPSSNNFLNITGGTLTLTDASVVFEVDGTGAGFVAGQSYSYRVGRVVGQDLSGLNITDQSRFSAVGFQGTNFSLTGDSGGNVYLNFTPVPEPGALLLAAAAGAAAVGAVRRRRG
jgi:autotransporter-associated beta strand protein